MRGAGQTIELVRVVLASPGDVKRERDRAQRVVDDLNRSAGAERGYRLELWRWEIDARPGMHLQGPQGLIDDKMKIDEADLVIGVFWKHFGTPTGDSQSGTEHELRRAWMAWRSRGYPDVWVYFCTRPYLPGTTAEAAQLARVVAFRETLPSEQAWWPYRTVDDFERSLREHLTQFLRSRSETTEPSSADGDRPDEEQPGPSQASERVSEIANPAPASPAPPTEAAASEAAQREPSRWRWAAASVAAVLAAGAVFLVTRPGRQSPQRAQGIPAATAVQRSPPAHTKAAVAKPRSSPTPRQRGAAYAVISFVRARADCGNCTPPPPPVACRPFYVLPPGAAARVTCKIGLSAAAYTKFATGTGADHYFDYLTRPLAQASGEAGICSNGPYGLDSTRWYRTDSHGTELVGRLAFRQRGSTFLIVWSYDRRNLIGNMTGAAGANRPHVCYDWAYSH